MERTSVNIRSFLKAGHTPSLFCAFLYFDTSFMVWVLIGALANSIVPDPDFQLDESQRGLMLALPILGGACLRILLGLMTDRIGARNTGIIGLVLTTIPLLLGWFWADSYAKILIVGVLLGIAGASFAAALPLASRWYPPQYQGLAMGIAGAGNSGTALATLFGPILAMSIGWHNVFGLALVPIVLTLLLFAGFARESPNRPPAKGLKEYGAILGQADTWWFCLFYSVTFGGFVGLATFLNSFFSVQYELPPVQAGYFATACVVSGSLLRPIGGYLADRIGGIRMLTVLYLGVAALLLSQAFLPPLYVAAGVLFLCMGLLGMGNGAVFQLVPLRFPKEIGIITGIVGAAGGVGGFFLPTVLGNCKQWTGTFAGGFALFAGGSFACAVLLQLVARGWEGVFVGRGGKAAVAGVEMPPAPVPAPEIAAVQVETSA
jgi:NNP family nitrate/nitrite transporter-like MFS transporter